MREILISAIKIALEELNIEVPMKDGALSIVIERPADMHHGDFSTNVALAIAKKMGANPVALAVSIVDTLKGQKMLDEDDGSVSQSPDVLHVGIPGIEKIEVAGPGFINFYQTSVAVKNGIANILHIEEDGNKYGASDLFAGKKIAYEYTNPNPFKQFHIGHLMANTIGESLSRLGENAGGEVKRFNYQGDVGRHVALTMWGLRLMDKSLPTDDASLSEKVAFMGEAYAKGATEYKRLEDAEKEAKQASVVSDSEEWVKANAEVRKINKIIYDRDPEHVELLSIYDKGREWSLEHFEELYKTLGTAFDRYFFESEVSLRGLEIVKENTDPRGMKIFKESEGAIIFPGEDYGLHTRVFINRDGLPTYEGKEVGLAEAKYKAYPFDLSITVSGNEQDDYFKVLLKVTELLFPEIGTKAKHVSHGMLRLTTGKMGSRTGNVITGESLIDDMTEMSLALMKEREMEDALKAEVAEQVAVAAIKYTVLRQSTGKDIIFDAEKSLSFEGDSGPYLQYACVRARAVLEKARAANISASTDVLWSPEVEIGTLKWGGGKLERLLLRFPEVARRSAEENAPHHVANYLMETAGEFNSFYASTQIVNAEDKFAVYKVALVSAFVRVMERGLWTLGIKVPVKM